MSEQQIPKLVGSIVEHQSAFRALSTPDAQWAINNTVDAIGLFVEAVRNRAVQTTKKVIGVIKRTLTPQWFIRVGGTTTKALIKAIEEEKEGKEKNEISSQARLLMGMPSFKISPKSERVGFISLTPHDLGFTSNPRTVAFMTKEFCAKWSAENLDGYVIELCEPEDGPQLRLKYQNQPLNEILWMAMYCITASGGSPRVFIVECNDDGGRWLDTYWVRSFSTWDLDVRLVFRLRKLPLSSTTSVTG